LLYHYNIKINGIPYLTTSQLILIWCRLLS